MPLRSRVRAEKLLRRPVSALFWGIAGRIALVRRSRAYIRWRRSDTADMRHLERQIDRMRYS